MEVQRWRWRVRGGSVVNWWAPAGSTGAAITQLHVTLAVWERELSLTRSGVFENWKKPESVCELCLSISTLDLSSSIRNSREMSLISVASVYLLAFLFIF